ncbi:hypothetical protein F8M41_004434 [Gigaspora margarita]|uniref:Uncharacterized protein n=1 Tax=Gigaspora margarita TaxID=4874 RepID=A0A8H4ERS4_GIGMA|nr:hypothetical protein F8M41_004434 [Gigaspora margarita]
MLEQNEPKLIGFFDELVEGLIPKTRSFYNQEEAKKSIVLFCYLFAGLRNKFANSYKLDIGLHLASAGTSYRGIDVLSNTGLTVSSKTVLRYKQQIVEDHFKKFSKKVNFSTPILANYNNVPLFNPVNIDANNLCKNLKQIYSSLFDRSYNYSKSQWISYSTFELDKFESINNLIIHLYEDAILEYKEERSMKDLQLVDFKELELHSFNNYADALKIIINVPSLNNYLNQNLKNLNLEKFGPYYKDTEYRIAIDLLDNIIPATLDIYAVLFRSDNNHPFNESIKSFLVHFNEYYVENVHSRIRAYTTKYSTTDEIIREAFVIEVGYQNTNFKSFHYHLPALDITVTTKQLPCGYSTKKIPSLINCDLCDTLLQNQYEAEVLICGHGYHIICYNAMEGRYIDEDNENENNNNNNNNDDDEVENLNLVLSEKDKIEQEFTDKLVNVLNW